MKPVLIAGAGPVGLCAALNLARLGIPFLLFEEDDGLSTQPKAGTILPSSLEIFTRLGVIDSFLGNGVRCGTLDLLDRTSRSVVGHVHFHELGTDTRYPMLLNLAQNDTEKILFDAICELGFRDCVLFGHELVDFVDDGVEIRAEVKNGSGSRVHLGSFLLGCDGGRSRVREKLGIGTTGRTYPETFALFNVEFDSRDADAVRLPNTFVFDPDEWMILVRMPGFWRIVWPQKRDSPVPSESDVAGRLRFVFGEDHRFRIVGEAVYNVHHRHANQFSEGRVFLLGDAAHLMTPVGGLGLNTGFQDAHNLCWKLERVLTGQAGAKLLETYETERLPIARYVTSQLADRNREMLMLRAPWKRYLRNMMLKRQSQSPAHRWKTAYEGSLLGVTYRPGATRSRRAALAASTLFPGDLPPVRPGDRAPDGPLLWPDGRVGRVHDLLGREIVALTFGDARTKNLASQDGALPAATHHWISPVDLAPEVQGRAKTLIDLGGRTAARYQAAPGSTYLLRPDGFVLDVLPAQSDPGRCQRVLSEYLDLANLRSASPVNE